ncbi:MAG: tetratricopeptide repeat protein [Candidatus Marinimicrobia bacterium]|nr:tetratricopeptide repeat protein [Candidatus Neomarinimicrobiota bacterium]
MKKRIYLALLLFALLSSTVPSGAADNLQYKKIKKDIPRSYRVHIKKGVNYLKKDQAYQARKIFSDMVKQHPEFYVYWGYGRSEWMLGNHTSARALYFKAFELNDSLYSFLQDYAEFTEEIKTDWIVIRRLAGALYALRPDDFALMFVIDKVRDKSDKKEAVLFFEALKAKYPENANIDVYHAILLSSLGENSKAVSMALAAIGSTDSPFQLRMLERILSNDGHFIEAARVCEKLNQVAKKSAYTYDAWGHLEFKQGHYENAIIHYEKALNLEYRPAFLMTLAHIYHFYLNNPAKAAYYCKAALQIDRSQVDAYFILAESFRKSGKMDKALQFSLKQMELLPDHPHPLYYHGKLLFELNRYTDAIPYLEQAVSISPDVQRYRLILAKTYAGAGLLEKARETYTNFLNEPINNLWSEEEALKEEPPAPR